MWKQARHYKLNPALSQVFLREDWPCRKCAELLAENGVADVLEIGPGSGILTRELLRAGLRVWAVEKDRRWVQHLEETLQPEHAERLRVASGDILNWDWELWLKSGTQPKAVCGNIPYNISSPVIVRLLTQLPLLRCAVLMVQLEFAKRLVAQPNSKDYGSLSVFTQLRSVVKIESRVARTCFTPVPKVDSALVSFTHLTTQEAPQVLSNVESLTRQAFSQRRKKLSNSLAPLLRGIDPQLLHIDLNRRCDTLTPQEFVNLSQVLRAEGAARRA